MKNIRDKLRKYLEAMVKIPSLSGEERKIFCLCRDILTSSGFRVLLKEEKVPLYLHAYRGNSSLILSSHVDVFPLYNFPGGFILKGRKNLRGRGVLDAKGQIAALFCALEMTSSPCQIVLTAREERTGEGSEKAKVEGEGCVVLEPTEFRICIAQAGSVEFRAETKGITSHGSLPWKGKNAIEEALGFYTEIRNLVKTFPPHPLFPRGGWVNLGKIQGGWEPLIVPERCWMEMEVSFSPLVSLTRVKEKIEKLGGERKVSLKWEDFSYPYEIGEEEKIVRILKNAYQKIKGEEPSLGGMECWTDAENFFSKGIPAVVFGAGSLHLSHTEREKVYLEELVILAEILRELIDLWNTTG